MDACAMSVLSLTVLIMWGYFDAEDLKSRVKKLEREIKEQENERISYL